MDQMKQKKKKERKNIYLHTEVCNDFTVLSIDFFFPMEVDVIIPMGSSCTGVVCLKEAVLFKEGTPHHFFP